MNQRFSLRIQWINQSHVRTWTWCYLTSTSSQSTFWIIWFLFQETLKIPLRAVKVSFLNQAWNSSLSLYPIENIVMIARMSYRHWRNLCYCYHQLRTHQTSIIQSVLIPWGTISTFNHLKREMVRDLICSKEGNLIKIHNTLTPQRGILKGQSDLEIRKSWRRASIMNIKIRACLANTQTWCNINPRKLSKILNHQLRSWQQSKLRVVESQDKSIV